MERDGSGGGGGGSRAGPAPPPPRRSPPESFPWLVRLPHFRPVEVLKLQAFDPEAPPVHVDYRRQFQSPGTARVAGKDPRGHSSSRGASKQSGWRETKEGEKFFVNSSGKQVRMGKARTGEGLKGSLKNGGAGARGELPRPSGCRVMFFLVNSKPAGRPMLAELGESWNPAVGRNVGLIHR